MFLYPSNQQTITDLDSLFPRHGEAAARGTAEEALQSHMIVGFEEALGLGLTPMEALSQILCWVSSEMTRIGAGEDGKAILSGSSRER